MFQPLFVRLSDRYHLVAPDYPGFGHSDWPDPKKFAYTFDHYAEIMNHFTETLGLSRYTRWSCDFYVPDEQHKDLSKATNVIVTRYQERITNAAPPIRSDAGLTK
jgi:hypothetical protein